MTTAREQPWRDDGPEQGRIVMLTRNPISEAIETIAGAVGRTVVLIETDENGEGLAGLEGAAVGVADAVVLCDHDAPDAPAVLRAALESPASYVAMLASRNRTAMVLEELRGEGYVAAAFERLHMPAGLNTGGKGPGEIALSVVAEVVAVSYGRPGGAMRG
ncbi:MAG: XdhC family protein [Nocardioidaceae bacterium]